MSDNQLTPRGTARINSEVFDTELAAVWYAANYYYESSFRRQREYIGVIFRKPDNLYGLTVRRGEAFDHSKIRVWDVPAGTVPTAVWHTHLPLWASGTPGKVDLGGLFSEFVSELLGAGYQDFSDADRGIADDHSRLSRRLHGHTISIYLVTAELIKRYRPGLRHPEKSWAKEPPGRMRSR